LYEYNFQLWLKNHPTLYDVESRNIAPSLSDYFCKKISNYADTSDVTLMCNQMIAKVPKVGKT